MSKLILVTGATGYIASRLIPRLLDSGHRVRALARDPLRLKGRSWFDKIEVLQADAASPSSLVNVLDDVDTAYYLIHNMSLGHGYTTRELDAARAFASAAAEAGVKHIIYLGGLADPGQDIALHMRSRIKTGKVLREGRVPVTEFRAGVIAGSGSISFEMIRFMTELFPIVPGPVWMRNKSQPIAIQNVIDYLLAALTNPNGRGGLFEIGGPKIYEYGDLITHYARTRGLKRSMLLIPGLPVGFMAFGVGLMTPVPYPIAHALIGGLSADSVVKNPEALIVFPEVELIDFDTATRDALERTHPQHIERVWVDGTSGTRSLKHEGCFILHRTSALNGASFDFGLRNNRSVLYSGRKDHFNEAKSKREITREHHSNFFGELWLEQDDTSQTLFFSPHGLPGFLYWYLLYPFHWLRFHVLFRNIARQS
jgi:uncharacterized protein YbjT (DUF2867 family)